MLNGFGENRELDDAIFEVEEVMEIDTIFRNPGEEMTAGIPSLFEVYNNIIGCSNLSHASLGTVKRQSAKCLENFAWYYAISTRLQEVPFDRSFIGFIIHVRR